MNRKQEDSVKRQFVNEIVSIIILVSTLILSASGDIKCFLNYCPSLEETIKIPELAFKVVVNILLALRIHVLIEFLLFKVFLLVPFMQASRFSWVGPMKVVQVVSSKISFWSMLILQLLVIGFLAKGQ